jgi:protein nanos 1
MIKSLFYYKNNKIVNMEGKLFCKFCKDFGSSPELYENHTVKNRDGIITCPTLSTITCTFCRQKGHTQKYCPTLKLKTNLHRDYEQKKNFLISVTGLMWKLPDKDIIQNVKNTSKKQELLDIIEKYVMKNF